MLNNFALGEMEDEQYFNINYKGGLNSFMTLIKIQTGLEDNKIIKKYLMKILH